MSVEASANHAAMPGPTDDDVCVICLESLHCKGTACGRFAPCNHTVHQPCAVSWVRFAVSSRQMQNESAWVDVPCPMCRTRVHTIALDDVMALPVFAPQMATATTLSRRAIELSPDAVVAAFAGQQRQEAVDAPIEPDEHAERETMRGVVRALDCIVLGVALSLIVGLVLSGAGVAYNF